MWMQSRDTVTLHLYLPQQVRGKDIAIRLNRTHKLLQICLKSPISNAILPILESSTSQSSADKQYLCILSKTLLYPVNAPHDADGTSSDFDDVCVDNKLDHESKDPNRDTHKVDARSTNNFAELASENHSRLLYQYERNIGAKSVNCINIPQASDIDSSSSSILSVDQSLGSRLHSKSRSRTDEVYNENQLDWQIYSLSAGELSYINDYLGSMNVGSSHNENRLLPSGTRRLELTLFKQGISGVVLWWKQLFINDPFIDVSKIPDRNNVAVDTKIGDICKQHSTDIDKNQDQSPPSSIPLSSTHSTTNITSSDASVNSKMSFAETWRVAHSEFLRKVQARPKDVLIAAKQMQIESGDLKAND
jgi:hypothetical protein